MCVRQTHSWWHLATMQLNLGCQVCEHNWIWKGQKCWLPHVGSVSGTWFTASDHRHSRTSLADGELYAGVYIDFMGTDSAIFRTLGKQTAMRTDQYNSRWLNGNICSICLIFYIYIFFHICPLSISIKTKIFISFLIMGNRWSTDLVTKKHCRVSYNSYYHYCTLKQHNSFRCL